MILACIYLIKGHRIVIWNIFSVASYTKVILAYSVSQKPILMIVLQNVFIKFWMIGKTSIGIPNMAWPSVTR